MARLLRSAFGVESPQGVQKEEEFEDSMDVKSESRKPIQDSSRSVIGTWKKNWWPSVFQVSGVYVDTEGKVCKIDPSTRNGGTSAIETSSLKRRNFALEASSSSETPSKRQKFDHDDDDNASTAHLLEETSRRLQGVRRVSGRRSSNKTSNELSVAGAHPELDTPVMDENGSSQSANGTPSQINHQSRDPRSESPVFSVTSVADVDPPEPIEAEQPGDPNELKDDDLMPPFFKMLSPPLSPSLDAPSRLLAERYRPLPPPNRFIKALTSHAPSERTTETLFELALNTQRALREWQDEYIKLDKRTAPVSLPIAKKPCNGGRVPAEKPEYEREKEDMLWEQGGIVLKAMGWGGRKVASNTTRTRQVHHEETPVGKRELRKRGRDNGIVDGLGISEDDAGAVRESKRPRKPIRRFERGENGELTRGRRRRRGGFGGRGRGMPMRNEGLAGLVKFLQMRVSLLHLKVMRVISFLVQMGLKHAMKRQRAHMHHQAHPSKHRSNSHRRPPPQQQPQQAGDPPKRKQRQKSEKRSESMTAWWAARKKKAAEEKLEELRKRGLIPYGDMLEF